MEINFKLKDIVRFFIVLTICTIIFLYYQYYNEKNYVSYNSFIELVNKNEVKSVKLNLEEQNFKFKTNDDKTHISQNPKSIDFKKFLLEKGIKVKENEVNFNQIIDIASIICTLLVVTVILKSITPKDVGVIVEKTDVKLEDVAGIDEIKEEISATVKCFLNKDKLKKIGATPTNGILLYGEAGTGKTMIAKAIANYGNMSFISANASNFVELYVGMGARKIRALFKTAREKTPCVLFIDEIDAIGGKRNKDSNSERDQSINALLSELDGFSKLKGVLVIAATNRKDTLDDALIRAGRFDKHIYIPMPNIESREQILNVHFKNKKLSDDVSIKELAKITYGMSGAKIASIVNESALLAFINNRDIINKTDIEETMLKLMTNGFIKTNKLNYNDKKISAIHEAGHVVCSKLLLNKKIYKVMSKSSTSGSGGLTIALPNNENFMTNEQLEYEIMCLYGGSVAEKLLLGNESNGASGDISSATKLIVDYISKGRYVNRINYDGFNDTDLFDLSTKLSDKLYNDTIDFMNNNLEKLKLISNELYKKEELCDNDIDKLLNL